MIAYNAPPVDQPGLWCQWEPNAEATAIVWDECEKSYNYIEWLRYLIKHFLEPWGYVLNGSVRWLGENHFGDYGTIIVTDNEIGVTRTWD